MSRVNLFAAYEFKGTEINGQILKDLIPSKKSFDRNSNCLYESLENYFGSANPETFSKEDLKYIFCQIDEIHFNNLIKLYLCDNGYNLDFVCSTKLTSSAGKITFDRENIKIAISLPIFEQSEKGRLNGGIACKGKMHSLILTMQHEMTHLIMRVFKIGKGHDANFKAFVKNNFGHVECTHMLKYDTSKTVEKDSLEIGMWVNFDSCKKGQIQKINTKSVTIIELGTNRKLKLYIQGIQSIVPVKESRNFEIPKEPEPEISKELQVGKKICFGKNTGKIVKINRVNVIVITDDKISYNVNKCAITKVF